MFSLGNSRPSRNLKVANVSPGLPSHSYAGGKQHSDTQKRNIDSKELLISNELKELLKLKHINLGKKLTKKVAHLLKSRPSVLASLNKELKDASHHSPKVKDSRLHGSPKSIHEAAMNSNEQGTEMDDQVINSFAELTNAGTVSRKPESFNPEANLAHEKHEPHHKVPEQDMPIHHLILNWALMNLNISYLNQ